MPAPNAEIPATSEAKNAPASARRSSTCCTPSPISGIFWKRKIFSIFPLATTRTLSKILPPVLTALATMQKLVAECRDFLDNFDRQSDNFFFYGDTGVGKTFLSHCIAKELIDTAHSVIYFTAFELFDLFSKTTFSRDRSEAEELKEMHSYVFDCDLLIIDDLGTELTNSFVASQLFLCVNERLLARRSTIISTNLPSTFFGIPTPNASFPGFPAATKSASLSATTSGFRKKSLESGLDLFRFCVKLCV